jgi:hypothetical protein
LPDDVQNWLRDVDQFVVVIENDGIILKKAHSRRTLEEMITKEKAPCGAGVNEVNGIEAGQRRMMSFTRNPS